MLNEDKTLTFKARQINIVMSAVGNEEKRWTQGKRNWIGNPTFLISCNGTYDKPVLLFSYKTRTADSCLASSNLFIYEFIHSLNKYLLSTYVWGDMLAWKQTPGVFPALKKWLCTSNEATAPGGVILETPTMCPGLHLMIFAVPVCSCSNAANPVLS